MTGKTILQYRVLERLGAGGMGEVYRAEDTRLGRIVALKFLGGAERTRPDGRRRLLAEARAASAINSPHAAVTHDIVEHDDLLFIVMEYVEGETIHARVERGPVPPRDAVEIALQAAEALDAAHSRGIIHRDIKSANLMITPRGLVKVLDFGLAKFLEARQVDADGPTQAGTVLGTVSYLSPEQALAQPLDGRSDLFSLGVVFYQMLTARMPFEGASLPEVLDKILNHRPSPPRDLNPAVPAGLSDLVLRLLAKDPTLRPGSARILIDELRAVRNGMEPPAPAGSHSALEQGAAVPMAPPDERAGNGSLVAVMTFSNITGEPTDDWIGSGIAETVTADLQKVEGLSVIARTRIFEVLKEVGSRQAAPLDERLAISLGRRLGASWIVRGGYQRMGPHIRITAELLTVRTGDLSLSLKVDGKIEEIFELQDRLVLDLTRGLNLKIRRSEIVSLDRGGTKSLPAYEAYSRAMMNFRLADRDALDRAIYLFDKALEIDPQYASAWAALGAAYNLKGNFLSMPELLERAIECERKAITFDPQSASARSWLAAALGNLGRTDEALDAAREGVRLDPQNSEARGALGRLLWSQKGKLEEGAEELERAAALNPEAGYYFLQLGFLNAILGRLDRAEEASRKAVDLQEKSKSGDTGLRIVGAHTRLGYVHYLRGRLKEAIEEYRREADSLSTGDHLLRERSQIELNQKLGAARLRDGEREEAEKHFQKALRAYESRLARGAQDPYTGYYIACVHALRGDAESALKVLRAAVEALPALNGRRARSDPDLESIRSLPAFQQLLVEVNS
jgi:tetratricopeptide (TPR) repeat protein/predicted Ser/Thr protein kinase